MQYIFLNLNIKYNLKQFGIHVQVQPVYWYHLSACWEIAIGSPQVMAGLRNQVFQF